MTPSFTCRVGMAQANVQILFAMTSSIPSTVAIATALCMFLLCQAIVVHFSRAAGQAKEESTLVSTGSTSMQRSRWHGSALPTDEKTLRESTMMEILAISASQDEQSTKIWTA